jgi:hypothetical protein
LSRRGKQAEPRFPYNESRIEIRESVWRIGEGVGETLRFFAVESLLKADKHATDVSDVPKLSDSVWDRIIF